MDRTYEKHTCCILFSTNPVSVGSSIENIHVEYYLVLKNTMQKHVQNPLQKHVGRYRRNDNTKYPERTNISVLIKHNVPHMKPKRKSGRRDRKSKLY